MLKFINNCEFCAEVAMGSRDKRLPFGILDSKYLVILDGNKHYSPTEREVIEAAFPDAVFAYTYACRFVDYEDARVGCGILLRNAIKFAKVIVLPEHETQRFFTQKVSAVLEFKTGQFIIPYTDNPVRAQREYERVLKQL